MPGFGGGGFGGGGGYGGRGGGGRRPPRKFAESEDPESEQFRKLFIGGLSYETDEEGLKQHFGQWGEITDVVVMKDPQSKRSRGFGFVTFGESANVDNAQASRPHKIDNREVETKRAMRREDSGDPDVQQTCKKLFVGGMKEGTDEAAIREVFEEYGEIKEVNVVMDKNTGKTKGFAFIEFEDYDSVDKCVLKRSFVVAGKNVEVKKAKKKEEGGGGGRGGRQQGGGGYGGGGGGGGFGNQGGYQGGYQQNYGGGYDDGSGYGGGYNQNYNQGYGDSGGYGGGYGNYGGGQGGGGGGGGNWNQGFGQGYGASSGGGPMRGGGFGNQSGGAPYNRGRGGGRGRGRGGGGGGGGY